MSKSTKLLSNYVREGAKVYDLENRTFIKELIEIMKIFGLIAEKAPRSKWLVDN